MKFLTSIFCLCLCFPLALFAQVPQGITYQAIVRNNNQILANTTLPVELSLFEGAGGASLVYTESQTASTNQYGLLTLTIGNGVPLTGLLTDVNWNSGEIHLEVSIDPGSGLVSLGKKPLQTVPFAFHAQTAGLATHTAVPDLVDVDTTGLQTGQVLKWNGTTWSPDNDNGTAYAAGIGIDISGTVISNTGDTNPADDVNDGDPASGDLAGTYPAPVVVGIQGRPVSNANPLTGETLIWDGTQWTPATDGDTDPNNELQSLLLTGNLLTLSNGGGSVSLPGTNYFAGTGINITGNIITNTGDIDASNDITNTTSAGGDLSGTYPDPTVEAIQGNPVSSIAPTNNQVLKFINGQWVPSADEASPWTQSGNDLSYTTGQVSVGTPTAVSPLTVAGTTTLVNGSGNARVESGISNDEGFVRIYDSNNQIKAGLIINGAGQGEVFGDVKNFRVPHPDQPETDIWYASLEGPEAAAYARGTATLVDGKVVVQLPEHFQLIASQEGMTVMLTPLSAASKGLAVTAKSLASFTVEELMLGAGNYSFDWEVKAVRQGHENFQVLRPSLQHKQ